MSKTKAYPKPIQDALDLLGTLPHEKSDLTIKGLRHFGDSLLKTQPSKKRAKGKTEGQKKAIAKLNQRKAKCDTMVAPAKEWGFQKAFIGENCWYEVSIHPEMKGKLKYLAIYRSAPISAVTHIVEIDDFLPYKKDGEYKEGKYIITFKGKRKKLKPIPRKRGSKKIPYGPIYTTKELIDKANTVDDLYKDILT